MSVITWVRRKSRLASLINEKGGISVGVALKQAEANLAPMREEGMAVINDRLKELTAIRSEDGPTEERVERAYRASSAILDAASPFDIAHVSEAAHNLCEIADSHQPGRPFDWRVVDVHVRAMTLLMSLPTDATAARDQVLQGLHQVAQKKGVEQKT